jgi:hypothetical protein
MQSKSFQLEQTVPGSFFFQGIAGGLLSGFICLLTIGLWVKEDSPSDWVIPLTPVYMIMGAIVGVVQATLIWGAYRITGLQLRVLTRVAATTICIALISAFIYYKQGITNNTQFATGVGIWWLAALPVALLVGSLVKPWEFFTFGSLATSNGTSIRSRSVLATLGTLPLRLLSIFAIVVWILTFACLRYIKIDVVDRRLLFAAPLLYFAASTYLTFRSPRKRLLLVIGILLNVPTAFLFYLSHEISFSRDSFGEEIPWLVQMSGMFLIAWAIFLVARMCAGLRTRTVPVRAPVVFYPHTESDHHCLGSRFSEWHQQVALTARSN